jgi:hypothetical protein
VGRPLCREGPSLVYNCCWPSPAHSFSGSSIAGLMTRFYCLKFEAPPTWRARSPYLYPPGTGWPSYTPRHWVPFQPPPTTCRWRYSNPPQCGSSELLCDWRFTAHQFVLATSPLRLTISNLFQLNTCGHSPYIKSSLKREWVYRLQLLLVVASKVRSESRGTHDHILLSQIRDSPNLEGPGPRIHIPEEQVAQLYPQALGSPFVASYDSQGYGGGVRTCLHTGFNAEAPTLVLFISLSTDRIESTAYRSSSIAACETITVVT